MTQPKGRDGKFITHAEHRLDLWEAERTLLTVPERVRVKATSRPKPAPANGPTAPRHADRDPAEAAKIAATMSRLNSGATLSQAEADAVLAKHIPYYAPPPMEAAIEALQPKVLNEAPKREEAPAPPKKLTPADLIAAVAPSAIDLPFTTTVLLILIVGLLFGPILTGTGNQVYEAKVMPWIDEHVGKRP